MKIREVWNHGRKRWRVTWRQDGKTKRHFFKTRKAAVRFGTELGQSLRKFGESWLSLPQTVRMELLGCYQRAKAGGYHLAEACALMEANGSPSKAKEITLSQLITRFEESRQTANLRPETVRTVGVTLNMFSRSYGDRLIGSIQTEDINAWIASNDGWGLYRRIGVVRYLQTLFRWALEGQYLTRNPMKSIKAPKIDHAPPKILSPERSRDLLELCRKDFKNQLPYMAICLFAGLRAREAERLAWEDVNLKSRLIQLTGSHTKTRSRRLVKIRPSLVAWLELCAKEKGSIIAKGHAGQFRKLRETFGGWSLDIMRHTFVSYELARSRDIQGTALESGHSIDVLFKHYREIVTPRAAREFWAIRP